MSRVACQAAAVSLLFVAVGIRGQSPQQPATKSPEQSSSDDTYKQQRAFATDLLNYQHYLEALPVFEDLAKRNPGDPEVLFGLGACLIQHSATLKDQNAGREERLRARSLLLRAKELGNNNILLNNLLDTLPADGSLRYPGTPEVVSAIQAGEAAFASNDYEEAITHYSKALELDRNNYSAALFLADCYFAGKNFPKAAEWYDRAIRINPDLETAYRYQADMFTKNGDQQRARQLAIRAVVAEPYSQLAWRGLLQWANSNHLKLAPVRINTHTSLSDDATGKTTITIDPKSSGESLSVWIVYNGVRLNWRKQEFKKNFPEETDYRHTLTEEVDALRQAAAMLAKEKPAAIAADPDLSLLKKISDAEMLEPYVLLSTPDRGIAIDYIPYREKYRSRLEEYLGKFIVPPPPANH